MCTSNSTGNHVCMYVGVYLRMYARVFFVLDDCNQGRENDNHYAIIIINY